MYYEIVKVVREKIGFFFPFMGLSIKQMPPATLAREY
jgi:hypothetical protein